jgi:hypothetical protein
MNVQRFKVLLAIYIICFVVLCLYVPTNSYFKGVKEFKSQYTPGQRYAYENELAAYKASENTKYINYGISYRPIFDIGFEDKRVIVSGSKYDGAVHRDPVVFIIVIELVILTVVFVGASYITCKKP